MEGYSQLSSCLSSVCHLGFLGTRPSSLPSPALMLIISFEFTWYILMSHGLCGATLQGMTSWPLPLQWCNLRLMKSCMGKFSQLSRSSAKALT